MDDKQTTDAVGSTTSDTSSVAAAVQSVELHASEQSLINTSTGTSQGMVWINIRLTGEENDRLIKRIDLDREIHVGDLVKLIESRTQVPSGFQEITLHGKELPNTERPLQSIKFGDELVVKHGRFDHWSAMLAYIEDAKKALNVDNVDRVSKSVDSALDYLKLLNESNFFLTYPSFGPTLRAFKSDFARYVDSDFKYIEMAAKGYFEKIGGIVEKCEKKTGKYGGGIQGGLIAHVSINDGPSRKYHTKVHIGLAGDTVKKADLREIFAYKALELMGVGPKVHFLPNTHYSPLGLYIATEDVAGFREAEGVDLSADQKAQLDLVSRIFNLWDLHNTNYGIDANEKLIIVDFRIRDEYKDVKFYWGDQKDKVERQRIARECFEAWKPEEMITKADGDISGQKELFRARNIGYKPSCNFAQYLEEVRKNVRTLSNSL